jgi:hypothetical protein
MNSTKLLLILCFSLFLGTDALAKSIVTKVSRSGKKLLLNVRNESLERGQELVLIYKGRKAGIARVLKVSKKGTKAIAQLMRGKAVRGLVAMDEYDYDTQKVASSGNDPWADTEEDLYSEFDDGYSSSRRRSSKRRRPASIGGRKGFLGALLGYDYEFGDENLKGGLSFGVQGGYMVNENMAIGGRVFRSSGKIEGEVNTGFGTSTFSESTTYTALMVDGYYFFSPHMFAGPSVGYASIDCEGCKGESGIALGVVSGYEYMVNENFGIGARLNLTYAMISEEPVFDKITTATINLSGTYWF